MLYRYWKKRDNCRCITEVNLRNFGIKDKEEIDVWDKKFKDGSYFIYNMDKAVSLSKKLINDGYSFTVMGDYDADGITGTTILLKGLASLGIKADYIIPDRLTDGYGAKPFHVEMAKPSDKKCLIFVDNGISCIDALKTARDKGYKVIILDHHTPETDETASLCDAVVDPEAEEVLYGEKKSDFDSYCGAGLAFSFIRKLTDDGSLLNELLAFAAIGTVCDVMPLREENFCIVKYGLAVIGSRRSSAPGLYALTTELKLSGAEISSKDLGFSYGPVINAASRMKGSAGVDAVIKLFMYDGDYTKKLKAADNLIKVNAERKDIQNTGILVAERIINEQGRSSDRPLIVYIPDTNEGIVGIIAGNISEQYKIPSIVLTDSPDEEGVLRGSGRSFGNYNMIEHLGRASDILLTYGGHPGACGLSLKADDLETLRKTLADDFPSDYEASDIDTLEYDLEIRACDVDRAVECTAPLAPFGEGHREIVFKIDDFTPIPSPDTVNVLSNGTSVKLVGEKANAFAFNTKVAESIPRDVKKADIIGVVSKNYFMGRESLKIEILDLCDKTEEKPKTTPFAEKLKRMAEEN